MRTVALGVCSILVFGLCALDRPAAAQPGNTPPTTQPPPPPPTTTTVPPPYTYGVAPTTRTERYGMKIAAVDGLAFGAMVVGAIVLVAGAIDNDEEGSIALGAVLMIGGAVTYVVGPPLVHSNKGNSSSAWKSLALRLGLPALGGILGSTMQRTECSGDVCSSSNDDIAGSLSGIGVLAAMVIDWTLLSKRTVTVHAPPPYAPYAAVGKDGQMTFGLAGSF
jgi:hypothetical protein